MDRLLARSLREIEAHTGELAQTEIGGFLVKEAAQLLAALRLWAQTQYRADQAVRDIPEAVDDFALGGVADDLRAVGCRDAPGSQWDCHCHGEAAPRAPDGHRVIRPPSALKPPRRLPSTCNGSDLATAQPPSRGAGRAPRGR